MLWMPGSKKFERGDRTTPTASQSPRRFKLRMSPRPPKNMIELTGSAWEDKIVGFLCAAGGHASYMSVMAYAIYSLMLDFVRIIPPGSRSTSHAFDGERINDKKSTSDQTVADELVRFPKALRT